MTGSASSTGRGGAFGGACASAVCWGLALAAVTAWLRTRPDCAPNFTRLLDVAPLLLWITVIAVVGSVLVALAEARTAGAHRFMAGIMVGSMICAALVGLFALTATTNRSVPWANTCWTF